MRHPCAGRTTIDENERARSETGPSGYFQVRLVMWRRLGEVDAWLLRFYLPWIRGLSNFTSNVPERRWDARPKLMR